MTYADFVAGKRRLATPIGRDVDAVHPSLFDWQSAVVRWALRKGRAAIFADCGLGKTLMQLAWLQAIGGRGLILTPLAVAEQTVREAHRFGIDARVVRDASDVEDGINVCNYERLHALDPAAFDAVVLDESSILKSYDGATRTALIEAFTATPYRLCCTATPAPNDHMELGNHAEFLGAMSRVEMLATYFVHDGGETQAWRLKGHAERDFWRWVCSWAVNVRTPADLGFTSDVARYTLPPLTISQHTVPSVATDGALFALEAQTLSERLIARRDSTPSRAALCADLVNNTDGQWIVWCNLNAEADALRALVPDAVEIRGSDDPDVKANRMMDFTEGRIRVLVTKPSIAGFGMNWQQCAQMAFLGLSDSWEQYYQAVRRCWRFGQTSPVSVHCIAAESEGAVVANLKRKDADAERMAARMAEHTQEFVRAELTGADHAHRTIETDMATGNGWTMHLDDCVDAVSRMPDASIGYSIFSPPFASLYTYSDSPNDMGNCTGADEFFNHFMYLIPHLFRTLQPGRLLSFHCMNLPTSKVRDGFIGIRDFRGELIRAFQSAGFIYHSEVVIWKDPVTAMQRTKALGLLHKTIRNDSSMSRQGIPDYLVTMRKPGDNAVKIAHTTDEFPVSMWQQYASPVWMDINPSDTLQHRSAREHADEKHICPLQLQVIRRAMMLWSAPGDVVLSPFAGIGSEGFVALEMGRQFVGVELKRSYWQQACRNLAAAHASSVDLFSGVSDAA